MNDKRKNWIQGSGSKLLIAFSALIYLLSFFLPAYSERLNLHGYECAYIVFGIAYDGDVVGGFIVQFLTRGHFLLLGLHNVIVPICLLLYKKIEAGQFRWLVNIFFISILNTIIFFFYNFFSEQMNGDALFSGYYVWVFASVLIYVLLKYKMKSNATISF